MERIRLYQLNWIQSAVWFSQIMPKLFSGVGLDFTGITEVRRSEVEPLFIGLKNSGWSEAQLGDCLGIETMSSEVARTILPIFGLKPPEREAPPEFSNNPFRQLDEIQQTYKSYVDTFVTIKDESIKHWLETNLFYQNTLQTFGKIPDYMFGLEIAAGPRGRKRLYFYLEADQGSEPIRSSNYNRSSLQKTLDLYATVQKNERTSGKYQPLGLPNFWVLITTLTPGRMDNLLRFIRHEFPKAQSALFLITSLQNLEPATILEHEWHTGAGQRTTLLS